MAPPPWKQGADLLASGVPTPGSGVAPAPCALAKRTRLRGENRKGETHYTVGENNELGRGCGYGYGWREPVQCCVSAETKAIKALTA